MKQKVDEIVQRVEEKRIMLKDAIEKQFSRILMAENTIQTAKSGGANIPPISYCLYAVAGGFTVAALASDDSKWICAIAAGASAYAGYHFTGRKNNPSVRTNVLLGIAPLEVNAKVIEIVNRVTKEWDVFMEQQQTEVYAVIDNAGLDKQAKDVANDRVYVYESPDINLLDFRDMIDTATTPMEVNEKIKLYKNIVLSAIDTAADKQVAKYRSIGQ